MKGSAPNCSRTGSQDPKTMKEAPNFRKAGSDSLRSTANKSTARKRTTEAKKADAFSNTRSFDIFPDRGGMDQYRDFPLKEICLSALSTLSTTSFGSGA